MEQQNEQIYSIISNICGFKMDTYTAKKSYEILVGTP